MAIVKTEAYYTSSTGVNKIRCCIWQDNKVEPVGIFQIAHGVSEHIGRYDHFARFLAKQGYIVCGNDHLGHGKSVNCTDELGFFAEENGDLRLVDDMRILHAIMKKRYPGLPYYLLGHSMGSFCARVYATVYGYELAGLVICGTGELPAAAAALEEPVRFMCKKMGVRAVAPAALLDRVSCIAIKDAETSKDWLSRNKENVQRYIDDPLCGNNLTLGAVRDILSLANSCCTSQWAFLVPVGLPILIISGAKDPIGLNGKGVIAVSDNLEAAGHEPTTILYPGDRHEILNEDDKDKVYADVLSWLKELCNR